MANIEGVPNNAQPGVYTNVKTLSRGVSIPGGTRVAVLMGEGQRSERIVSFANGSGKDGFNSTYTSSTANTDGRHFKTTYFPLISNRTTVFKNGIPLSGIEQAFTSNSGSFNSNFDYRLDISTGRIELQSATLLDQGGLFYKANALNVGNGTIDNLSLLDPNAPTETWTIRCASTRRDGYGVPIDGYARFITQGSVSGILLDGYGNQVVWQSNGVSVSNGILRFSISEGARTFREGDKFTVKVKGGALNRGDSLTVNYIAETDLNDPEFFTDFELLVQKHGSPSLSNRLSLGAQIAFANSPPGVYAVQAAPSVPRRVSYVLEESASGGTALDDLSFDLPLNVIPDVDSNIHFFVTDPTTEQEFQILPNKYDFYDSSITDSPTTFTNSVAYTFSYTVILTDSVVRQGDDGVITSIGPTSATISSTTVTFDSSDVGKNLKILQPADNAGVYVIASVSNGVATISDGATAFTAETEVEFEVIDDSAQSAKILLTSDLALSAGQSLRVTLVDTKDADFFDVNWQTAYDSLEKIECDMVVPLPSQTISSIFTTGKTHCETMSSNYNRKERILLIGAIKGLTPDHVTGIKDAAVEDLGILEGIQGDDVSEILSGDTEDLTNYSVVTAYGNTFRVMYFYPDEIVVQIGADRNIVDGFFMAAAAAGYFASVDNVAIPLTNKTLAGFTLLRNKLYRPSIIQNLLGAGICVVQPTIGGGLVINGWTTTQSGFPEEQEASIIFIRDRIAKGARAAFRGFVGLAESPNFQNTLMARANSYVQSLYGKLITAHRDLKVVRNQVEPRQWDIKVAVQPIFPINWISIEFDIGVL